MCTSAIAVAILVYASASDVAEVVKVLRVVGPKKNRLKCASREACAASANVSDEVLR
jgi:hypothetical protein